MWSVTVARSKSLGERSRAGRWRTDGSSLMAPRVSASSWEWPEPEGLCRRLWVRRPGAFVSRGFAWTFWAVYTFSFYLTLCNEFHNLGKNISCCFFIAPMHGNFIECLLVFVAGQRIKNLFFPSSFFICNCIDVCSVFFGFCFLFLSKLDCPSLLYLCLQRLFCNAFFLFEVCYVL